MIKKKALLLFGAIKKRSFMIIVVSGAIALLILVQQSVSFFTTREVYYIYKDYQEVFVERIPVKRISTESDLQAFVRSYFVGSHEYQAKLPFTHETQILSISHDIQRKILVLNWNSYIYKALEQSGADLDVQLFLKSLKKNYQVEKVYFLVEGAPLVWDRMDMSVGIAMDKIK